MANWRDLPTFAAAMAALAVIQPTSADAASPASTSFSKAESLVGGPSRLAQILAEQGAPPRTASVRPASYGIQLTAATIRTAERPASAVSNDRPDVFGSVALKVKHTPLDRRWGLVERARIGGRAAAYASSLRSLDETNRLEAINRYVNRRVRFVDDWRHYRRSDVWATANDTLNSGRGDCEDYAIAKLQMLRQAGFSDVNLYLVILKDLVRRSDHAVAVVRSGRQTLVLDNGTDQVLESSVISDYRPILTFAANGAWTHGYRVAQAPVELAYAR